RCTADACPRSSRRSMIPTVQRRSSPLLRPEIGDLLGEMRQVERDVGTRRREAAQLARLRLGPGVEVALVKLGGVAHAPDHSATAAGLLALGLRPGERVGIWAPNCAEWVITQLATAKAGLVLVNINPAYCVHELEYALNKVGCRALVLATRFKTSDYLGMLREL